jgi:hypothetical protein
MPDIDTNTFTVTSDGRFHGERELISYSWKHSRDGVRDDDWVIRGVPCGIGRFKDEPDAFYIIALKDSDISQRPNIGPFETMKAAIVAATLLESP